VWDCKATNIDLRMLTLHWDGDGEKEATMLAPTVVADATTENIQKAKEFINGLTESGGNMAVCCAGIAL
jgi:hypothetical protein